jgi:hypothetical protein
MMVRLSRARARQRGLVPPMLVEAIDVADCSDGAQRFEVLVNSCQGKPWQTATHRLVNLLGTGMLPGCGEDGVNGSTLFGYQEPLDPAVRDECRVVTA